jgi:hypothetical protein
LLGAPYGREALARHGCIWRAFVPIRREYNVHLNTIGSPPGGGASGREFWIVRVRRYNQRATELSYVTQSFLPCPCIPAQPSSWRISLDCTWWSSVRKSRRWGVTCPK